jgi:mono/diheme cytochrome c family protein
MTLVGPRPVNQRALPAFQVGETPTCGRTAAARVRFLHQSSRMRSASRTRATPALDRWRAARRRVSCAVAAAALALPGACATPDLDVDAIVALEIPAEYRVGAALYEQHCLSCHGPRATGSALAPPLLHPVYRTRHHGDEAFQLAVAQGVRAHHFRFGDMPAVPGISRDEVAAITAYVRWLQRAAGIE